MEKNKFNELIKALLEYFQIKEDCTAGGAMSVFGDVTATSTTFSDDTYAIGDSRMPKALGKGVIRRNVPELTVFATGVKRKSRKNRHKSKNNTRKIV